MTDTDTPPETTDPEETARWRGYTHKELYQMLHDGPGAASSASPSRRWAEISSTLNEISQDLKKAIEHTGAGWEGRAAGAAYERLSTTVTWASDAGAGAGIMRTAVEDQGDHIAKARADMPVPEGVTPAQPDPTIAPAVQVLQTQLDAEPAEAAASSAEERAVEVMAAYETNTKTTTASLASFDVPQKVLPDQTIQQGHGGGLLGIVTTVVSGLVGGGGGSRPDHHHSHHNDWRGPRNEWHSPGTSGSSAHWEDRRPLGQAPATPTPGPGKTMGVSTDPFLAGPRSTSGSPQERAANRGGNGGGGGGGGGGNAPASGSSSGNGGVPTKPTTGPGSMHLPPNELQAAAASQAAANAHPGAGAPMAPAGPVAGGQEKLALRRFGMDAIGSSQWFGDNDEPAVGESPRRRFDLRESEDVTEDVTILDEEHKLPPTVIGEGGR